MAKLSLLQFLFLRPHLAPAAPSIAAEPVAIQEPAAPDCADYIGTIREFERALRFCGWSRTQAKIDAPMRGKRVQ